MAKYIVNIKTGESLEVIPSNQDVVKSEYEKNPSLYRLEEDSDSGDGSVTSWKQLSSEQPEEMKRNIQLEQQNANGKDGYIKSIAKNVLRYTNPYSVETMEKTGKVTGGAVARDMLNAAATASLPFVKFAKPLSIYGKQLLGLGTIGFGSDLLQQAENKQFDPTRTSVSAGLNLLSPQAARPIGQAMDIVLSRPSEYIKQRAGNQLYSSLVPNKAARQGPNPVTPANLSKEYLETGTIPVIGTEKGAFEAMQNRTESELARKGLARENIESQVSDKVNVLDYDFDTQGQLVLGAISDAKQTIKDQINNGEISPLKAEKILKKLNEMDRSSARLYGSGDRSVKQASKLVTSLSKEAGFFTKAAGGAQTPDSEASMLVANAINDRIGMISPEHRAASKDMAINMSMLKPVSERASSNVVASPVSGIMSFPLVNELMEFGKTFNRRPQGAQLKHYIGSALQNNSPMIQAGLQAARQGGSEDFDYITGKSKNKLYGK